MTRRLLALLALSFLLLLPMGCSKSGVGDDDDDNTINDNKYGDPDPPGPCAAVKSEAPAPVSSDGQAWIVFHHCELGSCAAGNKQNDLWIVRPDATDLRQLTSTAAESGTFVDNRFLDFTADGRILYSSAAASGATSWDLHLVDIDGADTTLATNVGYYSGQTPTKVIFMRGLGPDQTVDPDRDLFTVDLGGAETTLSSTTAVDEWLVEILEGEDLIYSSRSGQPDGLGINIGDLYFVRTDGSGKQQLSDEPGKEVFAGITPGGRVVYTNIQTPALPPVDPLADIYSVRVDGSSKTTLANASEQEIAVAVAGEKVVIQFIILVPGADPNIKTPQFDLYAINADGTGLTVIANDDANNETLADVTTWCTAVYAEVRFEQVGMDNIAFTKVFGYPLQTGGASIELDDLGDSAYAHYYSSNGKKVFYNRAGTDGYVVNEDGSGKIALTTSPDIETLVDLALDRKRAIYKRTLSGGNVVFHSVAIDGTDDRALAPELTGMKQFFGRAGGYMIITHAEQGSPNSDVVSIPIDGGEGIFLAQSDDLEIPAYLMNDGNVIYTRFRGTFGNDLFIVPADGSTEPVPLVEASGDDRFAALLLP